MNTGYIAAIAGSAGSLDSLKQFFDHAPHDGVTYIVVQHLPRDYRSELGQILKRHSSLEIMELKNGMQLETDHIYVLPYNMYMRINGDRIYLARRENNANRAIDIFLTSLAENKKDKSIAVILSGTGDDGSLGVIRIKKAGGFTLAQDPETCAFPAMPSQAIGTGQIDRVLSCKEMAPVIQEFIAHNSMRMS